MKPIEKTAKNAKGCKQRACPRKAVECCKAKARELAGAKQRTLTAVQEAELCHKIKHGAPESRIQARNALVEANLKLGTWFAHRYSSSDLPLEDRIQECYRGLILAAEKFDASRGRFAHFAGFFMRRQMQRARAADCVVPVPLSAFERVAPYCRAFDDLFDELGRFPTDAEIGARIGWTPSETRLASFAAETRRTRYSLGNVGSGEFDPPDDGSQSDFSLDSLVDDDRQSEVIRQERLEIIRSQLDQLSPSHRRAIELWASGRDIQAIAASIQRTPESVASIVRAFTESVQQRAEDHDDRHW